MLEQALSPAKVQGRHPTKTTTPSGTPLSPLPHQPGLLPLSVAHARADSMCGGTTEHYLHRDLRESWSRKLWSFFTALMSIGNDDAGEGSDISGRSQASCSIRDKGQQWAWEEEEKPKWLEMT